MSGGPAPRWREIAPDEVPPAGAYIRQAGGKTWILDGTLPPPPFFPPEFLTELPRWLLWRTVTRNGLATKVPKTAQNTAASATDARTWAAYETVTAVWRRNPSLFDGTGIVLGDLGDGRHLVGLDLDTCLDDAGSVAEWAAPFLALLPSYTEVSPSGRGLKVFFFVTAEDAGSIRPLFGIPPTQWGCKRPVSINGADGANHGPSCELYFSGRYFSVTGRHWLGSLFDGATFDRATLERLAELVPKGKGVASSNPAAGNGALAPEDVDLDVDVDELQAKLAEAVRRAPKIKARWFGDTDGLADTTGSGFDFSLGAMLKGWGFSFAEMRAACMLSDHGTGRKHEHDLRHWQRIWERSSTAPSPSSPPHGGNGKDHAPEEVEGQDARGPEPEPRTEEPGGEPADHRPPGFSDEDLALRFSARHQHELRYVAPWGRWLLWSGSVWATDETLRAFDFSRGLCREASARCKSKKVGAGVASAKTVAAVERLAKADRRHAATTGQWDADPWLMNTPGGVVDQRTGSLRPHRLADFMTKITAVAPDGKRGGGACPLWHKFLDRVTAGDADLKGFLQRVAGYASTGSTREHALFFAYGKGANGKGVFLNTLTGILNSYATVAPMETFTETHTDRHPTDLAMLRGARLVAAQETEEGRRWAEGKVKALTGGDPVTARFMRQDFFTYVPQFKPFFAGNYKPALASVDEAIRRRVHLIPFVVTIPTKERDKDLPKKLRVAWPGILQWIVDGCLEWQRIGLAPPIAVTEATESYMAGEDAIGLWLEEGCDLDVNVYDTVATLFASWRAWAERAGERIGSKKRFSQSMEARGFAPYRLGGTGTRAFQGLKVKQLDRPYCEPGDDRA